jgi:hypothetical protein
MQTFRQSHPTSYFPALVAGMYNRRVQDVSQLWQRINFHITAFASDGTTPDFVQLFIRFVYRYLNLVGHPTHPFVAGCGLVSAEQLQREADDALSRSQLLLLATTESDLLPIENHWKITVCLFYFLSFTFFSSYPGTSFDSLDRIVPPALASLAL